MDIFSKIAVGEIPSYKCAENDKFYAFLDINPLAKGHTLVIPRREVDYIFDMEDDELAEFEVFAKQGSTGHSAGFPVPKSGAGGARFGSGSRSYSPDSYRLGGRCGLPQNQVETFRG